MRVLHAALFGGARPGGFIPLITSLGRALRARGDEFAFVVPRNDNANWHAAVSAAGAELTTVESSRELARFVRQWKPDVAHLHFYGWELPFTVALWNTPARVFWHAHSAGRSNRRITARSFIKYRVLGARVERFIAVSAALGEELVRIGAPRDRVISIPNAIDGSRFRPPTTQERAAARAELSVGDAAVVLFYGRDPALKGADVLEQALARTPGTTVVTVATPSPTCERLSKYARVIALGDVDDTRPLCWAADAVALPSRAEGFSFVLLEAALTGVPVIASDLRTLREVGGAYDHVHFAPVGDASTLSRELSAAFERGRSGDVAARSSPSGWAGEIMKLYERGLNGAAR